MVSIKSTTVLCIFHLLQQVWRWLHDINDGIALEDRSHILLGFRCALYAESKDEFHSQFKRLLEDDVVSKYPNFITYISAVYEDCESLACVTGRIYHFEETTPIIIVKHSSW